MIPQTQRWWRGPAFDNDGEQTDEGGDCFAACIASLLEVPIEGFPNFLDSRPLGNGGWFHKWQLWLYENYRAELTQLVWWIAGARRRPLQGAQGRGRQPDPADGGTRIGSGRMSERTRATLRILTRRHYQPTATAVAPPCSGSVRSLLDTSSSTTAAEWYLA